jgi:hypothetical protein
MSVIIENRSRSGVPLWTAAIHTYFRYTLASLNYSQADVSKFLCVLTARNALSLTDEFLLLTRCQNGLEKARNECSHHPSVRI